MPDETQTTNRDNTPDVTITEEQPGVFVRRSKYSKYVVEYHREDCTGAGSCAEIASRTFKMDDENKAEFLQNAGIDDDEIILAAAQSCPVFAIKVFDAETGEMVFPII
jgi:ferredoxin